MASTRQPNSTAGIHVLQPTDQIRPLGRQTWPVAVGSGGEATDMTAQSYGRCKTRDSNEGFIV